MDQCHVLIIVASAGMAHISDPSDSYSESVLPRPFLQGAALPIFGDALPF